MARKKTGDNQAGAKPIDGEGQAENIPHVQADNNSIAIDRINIGGDVGGNITIGHGAQVNNITNIIQGYGELFTRYDTNVRNFLEYYIGTSEKPVPFGGRE